MNDRNNKEKHGKDFALPLGYNNLNLKKEKVTQNIKVAREPTPGTKIP